MVRVAGGENLRFGFEAAKSTRVNDAVAVARVVAAVRMGRLRMTERTSVFRMHGPGGQRGKSCDGPLHLAPGKHSACALPRNIRTSARSNPARGRLVRRCSCPETPS